MNIDIQKAAQFIESNCGLKPVGQPNKKKQTPHQIRWNGEIVKMRTGKSVWPSLGAAKTALSNKFSKGRLICACVTNIPSEATYTYYCGDEYGIKSDYREQYYHMILDELQKAGILKFEAIK